MASIKIDCVPPYSAQGVEFVSLEVKPANFVLWLKIAEEGASGAKNDAEVNVKTLRANIKNRVTATKKDGTKTQLDDFAIYQMPLPIAFKVKAALQEVKIDGEAPGTILQKGDGLRVPTLYKLGKPLTSGGPDAKTIPELEFTAKSFGQLEEFVAADGRGEQVLALLKIAKPVGGDVNLLELPSWAIEQITVTEGVSIANLVVPDFLPPSE